MSIFIDSAKEIEVLQARQLGWVAGVTTNPTLLAQAGRPAHTVLDSLSKLGFSQVFYQLTAPGLAEMSDEAQAALRLLGEALVLKVPPTENGFRFAAEQAAAYTFCITAIYSPIQAAVAAEAGVRYVAVYVNRATRLLGDGIALVAAISQVLAGSRTAILAASLKSPEEAGAALAAGARHLTLPYDVLCRLTSHPLSEQTVAQFNQEGIGLEY